MNDIDRFNAWILPNEIAGKSFLDIGCADGGAGLYVLGNHASNYVGIDIDSQRVEVALKNIKTSYPNANATIMTLSIEEFLKQPNLKFDVVFLGRVVWGLGSDVLYKLSKISSYIVIESVNPLNHIMYDIISTYTTPEMLYELEYNHPIAEIYASDFKFIANRISDNRYLCVLYSIGYLKTIFNQLGFTANLDSYEQLKKSWPDEYGYGMSADRKNVKMFVVQFKLLGNVLPLTWAEWHNNV
jgi:SAM-dependent methyltransferase